MARLSGKKKSFEPCIRRGYCSTGRKRHSKRLFSGNQGSGRKTAGSGFGMMYLPAADTGLPLSVFEAISEAAASHVEIEKVVLFGSRAKGTWKDGSDIDLCLIGEGITRSILASISWKLNEEGTLPWKFDILVRSLIVNSALLEHIERVGIEVYTRNTLIQPKS